MRKNFFKSVSGIFSIIRIIFIFIFIYSIIEILNSKRKIIIIIKSNNNEWKNNSLNHTYNIKLKLVFHIIMYKYIAKEKK